MTVDKLTAIQAIDVTTKGLTSGELRRIEI
jgi:hypothetical protein